MVVSVLGSSWYGGLMVMESCWGIVTKDVDLATYLLGVFQVQLPKVERLVELPIPHVESPVPNRR